MHNDTPAATATAPRQIAGALPAVALAAVLAALIAPRATPVLLALLATAVLGAATLAGHRPTLSARPALLAAFAVMAGYLCLNSLWAVDPLEGLGRAALFSVIVTVAAAVAGALPALPGAQVHRHQRAVVVAVGLGALFLAIETPLGQPIRRAIVSVLPFLRPAPKHMAAVDGWVTSINLYTLNRNLALLNLVLWPTVLLLRARLPASSARLAAVGLLGLAALAMFTSEHETSMLALVVGCLVLAGMTVAAPVVRALVLAGWVAATLFVVPIAAVSHQAGLHQASWLPGTARNRIVLWSVTAEKIRGAPILGVGIGSTKPLDEEAAPTAERRPGDSYPQRTGRHSHNIFMQTWYELGAVGAVLLLVVGVLGLRVLGRLPVADQPYAYASFVSATVIASFTWGMWQPWFMCAFGIWAVLLLLGLDAARRSRLATA